MERKVKNLGKRQLIRTVNVGIIAIVFIEISLFLFMMTNVFESQLSDRLILLSKFVNVVSVVCTAFVMVKLIFLAREDVIRKARTDRIITLNVGGIHIYIQILGVDKFVFIMIDNIAKNENIEQAYVALEKELVRLKNDIRRHKMNLMYVSADIRLFEVEPNFEDKGTIGIGENGISEQVVRGKTVDLSNVNIELIYAMIYKWLFIKDSNIVGSGWNDGEVQVVFDEIAKLCLVDRDIGSELWDIPIYNSDRSKLVEEFRQNEGNLYIVKRGSIFEKAIREAQGMEINASTVQEAKEIWNRMRFMGVPEAAGVAYKVI